jgi:hypothetical protein
VGTLEEGRGTLEEAPGGGALVGRVGSVLAAREGEDLATRAGDELVLGVSRMRQPIKGSYL